MDRALEQFCRDCKEALEGRPGPAGRAEAVRLLERAVADAAFRDACF